MRSIVPTSTAAPRRHGVPHAALLIAALSLALAGCAPGGPAADPTPGPTAVPTSQESTMTTPESSTPPTDPAPGASATTPSASAVPSTPPSMTPQPSSSGAPALPADLRADLTVSITQDTGAQPTVYTIDCADGVVGAATDHPNADAACAALARLGATFFTARPNKDVICTQQYGGPQTASITGDLNGTRIAASFALTDGCQIARWNSLSDVLGTPGAQ